MPWWAWASLAVLLSLAELHSPGSYLIWIALGAAITAVAGATYEAPLTHQLATFAVAAAASCVVGYFVYRRGGNRHSDRTPLNERGLAMVGARGFVCAPIVNGEGKVRIGDSIWTAEGPSLPEGAAIQVSAVRGTRVVVAPAS